MRRLLFATVVKILLVDVEECLLLVLLDRGLLVNDLRLLLLLYRGYLLLLLHGMLLHSVVLVVIAG
jgi:hypothetical protein